MSVIALALTLVRLVCAVALGLAVYRVSYMLLDDAMASRVAPRRPWSRRVCRVVAVMSALAVVL